MWHRLVTRWLLFILLGSYFVFGMLWLLREALLGGAQ
jgi:hypothetical protein